MVKLRHRAYIGVAARATLEWLHARVGQDFYTLSASQVDKVLEAAGRVRYQVPKVRNGSRARYFYERLQREAKW